MIGELPLFMVVMQPMNSNDASAPDGRAGVRELLQFAVVCAVDRDRPGYPGTDARNVEFTVPLREACDLARREDLPAEQVLVMLKQSWQCVAETRALTHKDSMDALSAVVTQCIKEYYRPVDRR